MMTPEMCVCGRKPKEFGSCSALGCVNRKVAMKDLALGKAVSTNVENAPSDVNHPSHYTSNPSGIECIQVTEHMNFNLGNAVKYIWRNGLKATSTAEKDLQKAIWYIRREIERISK